jgi:hypothetical protein
MRRSTGAPPSANSIPAISRRLRDGVSSAKEGEGAGVGVIAALRSDIGVAAAVIVARGGVRYAGDTQDNATTSARPHAMVVLTWRA